MTKQEKARKRLKDLEDDPKHTTATPDSDTQTNNDSLNDPVHNRDGVLDKDWHKDANGNWHHPDFE